MPSTDANDPTDTIRFDARELLLTDNPEARTRLYLRLLYGRRWLEEVDFFLEGGLIIPESTNSMLATFDRDLLALEQAARQRNLLRHVTRACPSLAVSMSPDLLGELTAAFVNSPDFWVAKGRSLAENYCLFAHSRLPAGSFERDLVRLCGTVAGVSTESAAGSPWPFNPVSRTVLLPEASSVEVFPASWRLVDEAGRLPGAENLASARAAGRYIVGVASVGDRVVAFSVAD